jgi:Arc/MetJ-type ribon-helix-helix transcriptional regulator
MTITMELSDKEVQFLNKMISDMGSYEKISSVEEAVRECIRMAMYEESEHEAADEGV